MKKLAPALFGIALSLSCSQPSSPPEVCYQPLLLYIALDGPGNFNIYKNDLNGGEMLLTDNPSWDYAPLWNQEANSFTYYAYVSDTFRILRKGLDGKDLPLDIYDLQEYNLSPNNQRVVSEVSVGDFRKLVISDITGDNRYDITPDTSYNGRAKWSPDSQKIAYISDRDGNNEVYIYDLETKQSSRLTTNTTSEKYLSWAPDSERLLYSTEYYEEGKPDHNDLFVINTTTRATTQITDNAFEDSEVAWSPLGDRIAFHSKRDSVDHIFTMNPDGSDVRQITTASKYHGEPNWALIEVPCGD